MNKYRIVENIISESLKSNVLKDSFNRGISILLPSSYHTSKKRYPVIYLLPAFAKNHCFLFQNHCFEQNIANMVEDLINRKKIPEVIIVSVDGNTYYGSSQYINSIGTGKYQDFISKDVVTFIDTKYRTKAKQKNRAIIGKSSGGYGAFISVLKNPEIFSTAGCIAPDSGFEYCYLPFIPISIEIFRKYGGLENFCKKMHSNKSNDAHFMITSSLVAMSSCYSPNLSSKLKFDFICNIETGEIDYKSWEKWKQNDLIEIINEYSESLKKINFITIKTGRYDEYNMHLGSRIIYSKLQKNSLNSKYEEPDCCHFGSEYLFKDIIKEVAEYIE